MESRVIIFTDPLIRTLNFMPANTAATSSLAPGTLVCAHGLKRRADLNRLKGTVLGFDAEKGRYRVHFEVTALRGRAGESVLLKPDNVTAVNTVLQTPTQPNGSSITSAERDDHRCIEAEGATTDQPSSFLHSDGDGLDLRAAEAAKAGLEKVDGAWRWVPFHIRKDRWGGLGCFAVADHVANEVILAEAPLVRWTQSMHTTAAANLAGLDKELACLTPSARKEFYALYRAANGHQHDGLRVWMGSAFALDESDPDVEDAAVFARASRLNHACRPNAMRTWDALSGRLVVRATRTIARGEEILVSYLGDSEAECLRVPRAARQKYLLDALGFVCRCERCERGDMADDAFWSSTSPHR